KKRPPGSQPSDCWQVVRGVETLNDPVTGKDYPGNMILHGVFQIPQQWVDLDPTWTLEDITIQDANGKDQPIRWGGQIVQTLEIGLFAWPGPGPEQPPQDCVGTPNRPLPQPLQMMHAAVWHVYDNTAVPNPVGVQAALGSCA